MSKDREILRALAQELMDAAHAPKNLSKIAIHKAVNDLHPIRPTVLIDEVPWDEINFDGTLTPNCENEFFKQIEIDIRRILFQWKHFPVDMYIPPYIKVNKVITPTVAFTQGDCYGIVSSPITTEHSKACGFADNLSDEAALKRICPPVIYYHQELTQRRAEMLEDVLSDVAPVRIVGETHYAAPMDILFSARGDALFYDLADRPEFIHRLMDRLVSAHESVIEQYCAQGLYEPYPDKLHCVSALTDQLPHEECRDGRIRPCDLWGRGTAQIFAAVSPQMEEEFSFSYMRRLLKGFGLVYYGCCEPLHNKLELLATLPNLRKISVSPWSDVNMCAEFMGGRYVLEAKPNPAYISVSNPDKTVLRADIENILNAAKRYGCPVNITLKDITTLVGRPQNLFDWADMAMQAVGA